MFASVGSLEAQPGRAEELIAILTRSNPDLVSVGCKAYEVGVSEEDPNTVRVVELWESAEAHQASLSLPSVQAAISEAMLILTGKMDGNCFVVAGSPLR